MIFDNRYNKISYIKIHILNFSENKYKIYTKPKAINMKIIYGFFPNNTLNKTYYRYTHITHITTNI